MKVLNSFIDSRLVEPETCVFCLGTPETRDHCPSRIFLDSPYPDNLPVAPACEDCNNRFSIDEEYLACLISCVIAGSTQTADMERIKIKKILERKPSLRARIEKNLYRLEKMEIVGGSFEQQTEIVFIPEFDRCSTVLIKLAKGHGYFELQRNFARAPYEFSSFSLYQLSDEDRYNFETFTSHVYPEIGTVAMQRDSIGTDLGPNVWIVVQPNRYRYKILQLSEGIEIRIVIQEYLGCRIFWPDN